MTRSGPNHTRKSRNGNRARWSIVALRSVSVASTASTPPTSSAATTMAGWLAAPRCSTWRWAHSAIPHAAAASTIVTWSGTPSSCGSDWFRNEIAPSSRAIGPRSREGAGGHAVRARGGGAVRGRLDLVGRGPQPSVDEELHVPDPEGGDRHRRQRPEERPERRRPPGGAQRRVGDAAHDQRHDQPTPAEP